MYRAKVVNYINSFLISEGFHLKKEEDKTAEQLYYSKIKNDITIGIRFLSIIYETNHFYGFVNCNQIVLIENIVAKILYKNKITAVKPKDIYNTIMTRNYKKYRLPAEGILIDSERKVIEICNLFDHFYYEYFTPFYEKWKDLTVLYEYIKGKERREELSEILGQFWQFKKAAILRLCNDSNYQEFIDQFVKRREEILELRPDSIDVQRYCQAAKELKEVLDKTAPIYNV